MVHQCPHRCHLHTDRSNHQSVHQSVLGRNSGAVFEKEQVHWQESDRKSENFRIDSLSVGIDTKWVSNSPIVVHLGQ